MVKLAIIGAGIGGCSAVYLANKYLPEPDITIYEMMGRVGGRILTRHEEQLKLEMGATFFTSLNRTILGFVKELGLKIEKAAGSTDFAIWNGSEIVLNSNRHMMQTILELILRYKTSTARMLFILREAKQQISRLYEEDDHNSNEIGESFERAGLDAWYKKTLNHLLTEKGVDKVFIDEVVTPITRTIYSQDADIGGFAGLSSILAVYEGRSYSLDDGNSVLPMRLAERSGAEIKLGQKVNAIEKTSEGAYRVSTSKETGVFDAVVVATPMEHSGLEFDNISTETHEPIQYKTVYRRVVRGVIDPTYFGLAESKLPSMILTTEEADPMTHFSIQKSMNGTSLLMISSTEPLDDDLLDKIMTKRQTVLEYRWLAAYPIFKPLQELPKIRLDERLTYLNAMEPAASSMESSALSALKAVRTIRSELS
jgi:prenylcysteine oxidase/farnesylcysteine lyase